MSDWFNHTLKIKFPCVNFNPPFILECLESDYEGVGYFLKTTMTTNCEFATPCKSEFDVSNKNIIALLFFL